jgi:hypothetical protein
MHQNQVQDVSIQRWSGEERSGVEKTGVQRSEEGGIRDLDHDDGGAPTFRSAVTTWDARVGDKPPKTKRYEMHYPMLDGPLDTVVLKQPFRSI